MGRGKKAKPGKVKTKPAFDPNTMSNDKDIIRLTPERAGRAEFVSAGMARKLVPPIDTMRNQGLLSDSEWSALSYYRDQASLADRSPVKSCCDDTPSGGNGPGVTIISAAIETGRIERDLGALRDIARAVAVDDKSLAQWCIDKHGGRERYGKDGVFVAVVPVNEKRHVQMARMELRMAAHRICR